MTRLHARTAVAAMVVILAACASSPRSPRPPGAATPSRTVLSSEEMLKAGYPDVFTTVQSLRPNWLRKQGQTSLNSRNQDIKVYLDGSLLGGPDQLRQITTRSIWTVQYLDSLQASERWGLDHGMGAIVVSTRKN